MVDIILPTLVLFLISLLLALFSMRDLDFAAQIRALIQRRHMRGAIVFFDDGITHFEHHSSSSSKSE